MANFTPSAHYTHPALPTVFQAIPGGKPGEWFLKDLNQSAVWLGQNDIPTGILTGLEVRGAGIWRVCYDVIGGHRSPVTPKERTAYKPAEFTPCRFETVVIDGENWLGKEKRR